MALRNSESVFVSIGVREKSSIFKYRFVVVLTNDAGIENAQSNHDLGTRLR